MIGRIHSLESFGTVDGPGIRLVVFFQGCPMRCAYCHNPDTWELSGGEALSTKDILEVYNKNRSFYKDGGITATGGEPLMQIDFLTELFDKAHTEGIHTCLDTSGITYNDKNVETMKKFDRLMAATDLVLLDIKHINPDEHIKLTQQPNAPILAFCKYLESHNMPVWIRHVVIPGITDNEKYLEELGTFIGGLSNIKALDVLPYHTMGLSKYEKMGLPYPLTNVPALDKKDAVNAKEIILKGFRNRRSELLKEF